MARSIAIFGSARPKPTEPIYQQVEAAAKALCSDGWIIATGGGPGLMEAANRGALQECGADSVCSLGYSIFLPFEAETNEFVQQDTFHQTFFTRLEQFAECDAFIAMPGGYGTLLEIMTVIQLLQVGHMTPRPLILVGETWKRTLSVATELIHQQGHISESDRSLFTYAATPMDAVAQIRKLPKPVVEPAPVVSDRPTPEALAAQAKRLEAQAQALARRAA